MAIRYLSGINVDSNTLFVDDVNNRVGIGTASPGSTLDVLGKVSINGDGTLNWGNAKDYGRLTWDTGKAIVRGESGKALSLGANGTQDYLYINTSGNVGIGTTSPNSKLNVVGDAATNGLTVKSAGNSSTFPLRVTWSSGSDGDMLNVDDDGRTRLNNAPIPTVGGFTNTTLVVKQKANGITGGGLHIEQASTDNVAYFGFTGSVFNIGTSYRVSGSYQPIAFVTNGSESLRIANNGNVGIGTTSPNRNLTVSGNGTLLGIQSDTVGGYSEIEMTANGVGGGYIFKNSAAFTAYAGAGSLNIYNSGSIGFHTASVTNAMFIASATGNVGIGTTAPTSPLHISSATNKTITLDYTAGSGSYSWASFRQSGTEQFRIWGSYSDGYLSFYNDQVPAHQLTLASSGNVGIGTTSPGTKLEVNGYGSFLAQGAQNGIRVGASSSYYWEISREGINTGYLSFIENVNGTINERIRVSPGGAMRLFAYGSGARTGTVAYNLAVDSSGNIIETAGGVVDGSGTANYVSKWSDANTLTDSQLFDNGTNVGIGTTSPAAKLQVGNGTSNSPSSVAVLSADGGNAVLNALSLVNSRSAANGNGTSINFHNANNYGPTGRITSVQDSGTNASLRFSVYNSTDDALVERITLLSSGNVGIGTTAPPSHLSVVGNIESIITVSTATVNYLKLGTYYAGQWGSYVGAGSNYSSTLDTDLRLGVSSGGTATEVIRITSSGNVGIGTTAPGVKLDIDGGFGGASVRVKGDQPAGAYYYGYMYDGTNLKGTTQTNIFYSGSTIAANTTIAEYAGLRIDAPIVSATGAVVTNNYGIYQSGSVQKNYFAGNVGIGTTAPGYKLDVSGTAYVSDDLLVGATNATSWHRISVATGGFIAQDGSRGIGAYVDSTAAEFFAYNYSVGSYIPLTIRTSTLNIANNGGSSIIYHDGTNVGIGTTAPGSKLSVSGSNTGSVPLVDLVASGSGAFQRGVRMLNSGMVAGDSIMYAAGRSDNSKNMGQFYFYYAGDGSNSNRISMGLHSVDDVFNINGSGNVGIGTTAPSQLLHVSGNIRVTGAYYDSNNSAGSSGQVLSSTGSGTDWVSLSEITGVDGTGTANYIAKWSDTDTITNSQVFDNGTNVGINNASPKTRLDVNGAIGFGSKSMSMTDTFAAALTINMFDHHGCYVKLTAFGDWSNHSTIAYLGEFFIQASAGAYNEPGIIIRQVDNTAGGDDIQAQIVDPAGTGTRDFVIQLKATSASSTPFSAAIQYEVRGQYNSVS